MLLRTKIFKFILKKKATAFITENITNTMIRKQCNLGFILKYFYYFIFQ